MEFDLQNIVSAWDSVELMGLLFSTSGREKSMVSFTLERGYAFLRVLKSD